MQVFLYEYTTGGGLLRDAFDPAVADSPMAESLAAEGTAMIQALAADFSAIEGVEVVALRDVGRVPDLRIAGQVYDVADPATERRLYEQLTRVSAWTLIVAPELGGALAARCRQARKAGGVLLNCTSEAIALAADKHALAEHLAACGVPVPNGVHVPAGRPWPVDFELPAVIKPCDGAGSCGVRRIDTLSELSALPRPATDHRLEQYCPGLPASVGLLCGPEGNYALPACRQHLGGSTGFEYQGGSLLHEPDCNARAQSMAQRAADCLGGLLGFVGVDLVLGEAADGSQDFVIEINPRLTTSYVGLRVATQQNLAAAMLAVAEGREARLSFAANPCRFSCDGRIDRSESIDNIHGTQRAAHSV